MATNTTNYSLIKPEYTDTADVADFNANMDTIDSQMKANADSAASKLAKANVYNGLDKTASGYALDARQGPTIQKLVDDGVYYGTCGTAAATQEKAVTVNNFPSSLKAGQKLAVKFTNAQTYNGQPTLKVNALAAKNVCRYGTTAAARYEWNAGEIVEFVYDGTNFVMVSGGVATTTYFGRTKLTSALDSSSETLAATAKAAKTLNDNKAAKGATGWQQLVASTSFNSTEKNINTYNSRKFSDYSVLVFLIKAGGWIRQTAVIQRETFTAVTTVSIDFLQGGSQKYCDIRYKSDTKISAVGNATEGYVECFGLYNP